MDLPRRSRRVVLVSRVGGTRPDIDRGRYTGVDAGTGVGMLRADGVLGLGQLADLGCWCGIGSVRATRVLGDSTAVGDTVRLSR